jgi:cysteine-S-conjugate beta-lyase
MVLRVKEAGWRGLEMARWFEARPEVKAVLHPALPSHPGHALWKRDFLGATGLFSIILHPVSPAALAAMVDGLDLFGIGASWGGYESLVLPFDCTPYRTATPWEPGGPTLRFQIGLEDIGDLQRDLAAGFDRLKAAS